MKDMKTIPITILLKDKILSYISGKALIRDTVTTTLISVVGKGAGFLIPFFIAAWFGVTSETDAFFFAYGLIIFLATIFSPVVESIIVPFIAEARANVEDVGVFVGRILGISAIGLSALSLGFLIVIKPVLSIIAKFPTDSLELIFLILLESTPLIVLLVWTSVLAGTLNAYKIFGVPAISPALRAAVTLGFIFFFKDKIGIHAVALGYVAGEIFRLFVLFGLLRKLNLFQIKFSFGWDQKFKDFFNISSYQIVSMSLLAFTSTINKTMASWIGPGKVTVLEYADRLYMIPIVFISSGFIVTLLPHWSERYQKYGDDGLKADTAKAIKVVGTLGIVLTIFLLATREHLVSLVYGHGQFPKEKLDEVRNLLGYYLLGITPYLLSQVYVRAFLTIRNTRVLLITSVLIVVVTILLNLIFMRVMGATGIALSASVGSLTACIFLIKKWTNISQILR